MVNGGHLFLLHAAFKEGARLKVLSIFGTRPEAIKMAPLVKVFDSRPEQFESVVCVTAQHRHMLDQVLEVFGIQPRHDLNVMKPGQNLFELTAEILVRLREVFAKERPDMVLVHGDTTTAMAAGLAAFYSQIPIGHVEAGLRTGNIYAPFPEEINRKIVGCMAQLHFAPTAAAEVNLLREGIHSSRIYVTGNTVVDALMHVVEKIQRGRAEEMGDLFRFLHPGRRLILVTGHRRENFGAGLEAICEALADIALQHEDVEIIYPVHLNPNVQEPVKRILGRLAGQRVHLVEPMDYVPFVYLMTRCHLVLTDSGGIQEEAPCLGKPVLVMRDATERPEAVAAGGVQVVGASRDRIVAAVGRLLTDGRLYNEMSYPRKPFGDGNSSRLIADILSQFSARRK